MASIDGTTWRLAAADPGSVPLARLRAGLSAVRSSSFTLDEAAGTVTWDGGRGAPVVCALPGRTTPDRPLLASVVVVSRFQKPMLAQGADYRQLVLVDVAGRAIATTVPQEGAVFDRLWPMASLQQLARVGISVDEQRVRSPKQLQHAFPGADPHWRRHSARYQALLTLLAVVILVVAGSLIAFAVSQ